MASVPILKLVHPCNGEPRCLHWCLPIWCYNPRLAVCVRRTRSRPYCGRPGMDRCSPGGLWHWPPHWIPWESSLNMVEYKADSSAAAVAGYLADSRKSRRPTYMLGLIALAASTAIFSVGRSLSVLIIGRLIQGASSAFVHCVGVVRELKHEKMRPRTDIILGYPGGYIWWSWNRACPFFPSQWWSRLVWQQVRTRLFLQVRFC